MRDQISEFRHQLANLECHYANWGLFEAWISGFRPFLGQYFPNHSNAFELAAKYPKLMISVGGVSNQSSTTIAENNRRVHTVSQKLLNFVDSLLKMSQADPPTLDAPMARLLTLLSRFHAVAQQLRKRREHRDSLWINDEYDVQDLLHALLRIDFDDIRPEEWTPSYAGKSSRMDFLLKKPKIVVEAKMTREKLTDKEIGDELLVDIARYKGHPDCKTLVCFIYDREQLLNNPAGLIHDLEQPNAPELAVVVCICRS